VLYTGTGASRNVVGVGFTPDLVWIKERTSTSGHIWFDSVRGPGRYLFSVNTSAEDVVTDALSSFDSDGFSIAGNNGAVNESSSQNYVAWCWRAGAGTTSTNTSGSITSVVSVNQDAGFSIVSFTSSSSGSFTIGHGLNKTPKFIITKERGAVNNWHVWHGGIMTTSSQFLVLNSTNALGNFTNLWGPNVPTSSVFGANVGSLVNANTASIAYCWAEIEGLSKFGSFVGNGNADGPFIFCNFSPAFVLIKRATGGTGNWAIFDNSRDSTNPVFGYLVAESSAVEERGTAVIDFTSNGFKIRNSWTTINSSGDTIIFAAFAQSPFSYSNSK
jgi:hypothetical protein